MNVQAVVAVLLLLGLAFNGGAADAAPPRPITVADEIGIALFGDPYGGQIEPITESPDGRFVAVVAERGILERNIVEDELRIYEVHALTEYLHNPGRVPEPVWVTRQSTFRDGPLITKLKWLRDSSGFAFLLRDAKGQNQLVLVEVGAEASKIISAPDQDISNFDIVDDVHYVYLVRNAEEKEPLEWSAFTTPEMPILGRAGTGLTLDSLLFSTRATTTQASNVTRGTLWAANGGSPHVVVSFDRKRPIAIYGSDNGTLALSPNGNTLVAAVPVADVPKEWEVLYPPPYPGYSYRLHSGAQDINAALGERLVHQYVAVDLKNGELCPIANGPTAWSAGWWAGSSAHPSWSADSRKVILPGVFPFGRSSLEFGRRPCVGVVDLGADANPSCVIYLKAHQTKSNGPPEKGYAEIREVGFADGSSDAVYVRSSGLTAADQKDIYSRASSEQWVLTKEQPAARTREDSIKINIEQSFQQPPLLMVSDAGRGVSRLLWDPNPQLDQVALGQARIYRWHDKYGKTWIGGLYLPQDYVPGRRYPLVIQTHGFPEGEFRPSGSYPTAFAARSLAATGILVLQIGGCRVRLTPMEGPCQVTGYESAIDSLDRDGVIDPNRVGIIGFSRTVFYVLEAITDPKLHFAAASITDGVTFGYWEYLHYVDFERGSVASESDQVIGARPFGRGLRRWVREAPLFKMPNVSSPVLINTQREGAGLLEMWEPYSVLRYLGKPVELILLNSDEHVLTNPMARIQSQGGSVDWFRFWLQGYEDPNPLKANQYERWEELCKMQSAEQAVRPIFCRSTTKN